MYIAKLSLSYFSTIEENLNFKIKYVHISFGRRETINSVPLMFFFLQNTQSVSTFFPSAQLSKKRRGYKPTSSNWGKKYEGGFNVLGSPLLQGQFTDQVYPATASRVVFGARMSNGLLSMLFSHYIFLTLVKKNLKFIRSCRFYNIILCKGSTNPLSGTCIVYYLCTFGREVCLEDSSRMLEHSIGESARRATRPSMSQF